MATQFDPIAKDESLNTTEATPRNIADVIAEGLKGIEDALPTYTEGDGIDISAQKEISVDTTFTEASTRANIASGDSLSTIWGKIKKFFTDLKAVAFSGAAADVAYGAVSVNDALDGLTFQENNPKASALGLSLKVHRRGYVYMIEISGSPTQALEPNNFYSFGSVSQLSGSAAALVDYVSLIEFNSSAIIRFWFDSNIYISTNVTIPAGSAFRAFGTFVIP